MSRYLETLLDTARQADCARNDEAMRSGAPVIFAEVKVEKKQAMELEMEGCDD